MRKLEACKPEMKGEVAQHSPMLRGSDFLAHFPHVRSRLGQTAAYASPERVREDVWNAASAGASHSSACPTGRRRK